MTFALDTLAVNCIDGEWRRGAAAGRTDIANPATSEILATLQLAGVTT
jgi:acyl-CoA reductase-like NAD-dependent aldehyde dehydrogenase